MPYNESQVKTAFWKTFHEMGEFWFEYLDFPTENTLSTQDTWSVFLAHLKETELK